MVDFFGRLSSLTRHIEHQDDPELAAQTADFLKADVRAVAEADEAQARGWGVDKAESLARMASMCQTAWILALKTPK